MWSTHYLGEAQMRWKDGLRMHRQAHILHAFKHTKQTWEHLANSMHVAVPEGCFLISLKCLTMHTAAINWKKTHFALTVFSAPHLLQEVYLKIYIWLIWTPKTHHITLWVTSQVPSNIHFRKPFRPVPSSPKQGWNCRLPNNRTKRFKTLHWVKEYAKNTQVFCRQTPDAVIKSSIKPWK